MEKVIKIVDSDSGLVLLILAWFGLQEVSLVAGIIGSVVVTIAAIWKIVVDTKRWNRDKGLKQQDMQIKDMEIQKLREEVKKLKRDNSN